MSISLTCACGKQLRVADEFGGSRIKCPGCGGAVRVPVTVSAPPVHVAAPAPAPPGMVRFSCACGHQMQARNEHAGRSVHCPGCNAAVLVPGDLRAGDASALAQQLEDADHSRMHLPPIRKRSAWPRILGVAALLLLASGLVWFFFFRGTTPADLALIPADAEGFVSVRVADVWNAPAVKEVLTNLRRGLRPEDLAAAMDGLLGFKPEEVERITVVVQDSENHVGWVVIALTRALDEKPWLDKLSRTSGSLIQEVSHNGRTYHLLGRDGAALYFVNGKLLVVGPEAGVKRSLENAGGKPTGALARGIELAKGKHHLVAALNLTDKMKEELRRTPLDPKAPQALASLLETQGLVFQADVTRDLTLEWVAAYDSDSKAVAASDALKLILLWAKSELPRYKTTPEGRDFEPILLQVETLLSTVTVFQRGTEVHVQARIERDMIALLPGQVVPTWEQLRQRAARAQVRNQLAQLGKAMHDYARQNGGRFPPAVRYSTEGKKLWSWRVELLPYLGEEALYKEFRPDEAWNGPHNFQLLSRMPKVYALPGDERPTQTPFQVFVGVQAAFKPTPGPGPRLDEFTDGLSNTLLIVECAQAVNWSEPTDLVFVPPGPPRVTPQRLGGHYKKEILAVLADGTPIVLSQTMTQANLNAAITPAGREKLPANWTGR